MLDKGGCELSPRRSGLAGEVDPSWESVFAPKLMPAGSRLPELHPASARPDIPWWAVAAAGASPVLLIGGFLVATAMQPASYNPFVDT